MTQPIDLNVVLAGQIKEVKSSLALFAFVNLGLIESMASGLLGPTEAVVLFYHAANCRVVHAWKNKTADKIMSHGVQLPDLFDALSSEQATREFHRELEIMRALCGKLLATRRLAA